MIARVERKAHYLVTDGPAALERLLRDGVSGALLTPRPPELLVLNEPETSLHLDLLPAFARLILTAARHTHKLL